MEIRNSPPLSKCRQMRFRLGITRGEDRDRSGCGSPHLLARTIPEDFTGSRCGFTKAPTKSCVKYLWNPSYFS